MKKIVIIGGGTLSHVRNHLSLAPQSVSLIAPAYGTTAAMMGGMLVSACPEEQIELHLTKIADPTSKLITNEDVENQGASMPV